MCHRISIRCMDFSLSSLAGHLGCIQFSSLQTILQLLAHPRPLEHSGLVTEVYLRVREINLGEQGGLFRSPSHPRWLPAPRRLGQLLGQAGSATAVRGVGGEHRARLRGLAPGRYLTRASTGQRGEPLFWPWAGSLSLMGLLFLSLFLSFFDFFW